VSRKDYRSLTIPEGLYNELEKYVERSNGSYVSILEVVREALKEYLKKILRNTPCHILLTNL
jgi:Arc/MetJ-type ribon-helix-helix transcriptional regulator